MKIKIENDFRGIVLIRGSKTKQEQLRSILADTIPVDLQVFIPKRWWYIGDICIISLTNKLLEYRTEIGAAFLEIEAGKARTILGKTGRTKGTIRSPSFEYLAGDENTETTHKELGCLFKIDAAKLTFSPGNHAERKRMINEGSEGEFIIDMFSCVGNLSLPLAVHKKPRQLITAEINPIAFNYLKQNIVLNNLEKIAIPILGDNRSSLDNYFGKADRVISGYLESDDLQIQCAINLCKKGGILHYHEGIPLNDTERTIQKLKDIANMMKKKIIISEIRRVKKYSPKVNHIVIDMKID